LKTERILSKPFENCYWVIPDKFLAGEYPGSIHQEEAASRIKSLLRFGINHFIDLTEESEPLEPYAYLLGAYEDNKISHQRFPIHDVSAPTCTETTRAILNAIDAHLQHGKTVYVHCWGGVGRTGLIVGCWLLVGESWQARAGGTGSPAWALAILS
jgi:protein-tyrosine phosphatase